MYRFPNNVTGLVGLVLLLLAACSDDPGPGITLPPTLPPPAPPTPQPPTSCSIAFDPDTVLFRVFPSGRIRPEKMAVAVLARCTSAPPTSVSLGVTLESEAAEWSAVECETAGTLRVCGEIAPLTHGRTSLAATLGAAGRPPMETAATPVVMNRIPWQANRCAPDSPSQLCRLLSLEFAVGETVQIDLNDYLEDADGDRLAFQLDPLDSGDLVRVAEVTFNESLVELRGIAEGYASFSVTVDDGWHGSDLGLGHVQVGCPGLDELGGEGTGRLVVVVSPGETPPRLSDCDARIFDAAIAYWERVLAEDGRTVAILLNDAGESWISSAYASGSGPTDSPMGSIAIGRNLGLLSRPDDFYNTVRHELAHVLGIGAGREWWDRLRNRFAGDASNPPDTHFVGELAYQAFLDLGGGDFYETEGVPVANGAQPTRVQPNSHWQQHVIDTELMVGCRDHVTGEPPCPLVMPVSTITLAALADMGWIVDMSLAEPGTRIGDWRY